MEKRPIRITFIPKRRPFMKNATSRLRAIYLVDHLHKLFSDKYKVNVDDPENADVIVINQSIHEQNWSRVLNEKKKRNVFVIYDVVGRQYDADRKAFDRVIEQTNLITVANQVQMDRIQELQLRTPCSILPDGIDYIDQLEPAAVPFNGRVVWFGNHQLGNLESSLWAIKYIANHSLYSMSMIGKKEIQMENVDLVEWRYEGFIKQLKSFGICFLSHDLSEQQKSNNRLLVTLANGIPTIVTPSPAYAELLSKFKLDYAIVRNEKELQKALIILSDEENRRKYLSEIQTYVLKKYNYNAIAKCFDQNLMKYYQK